MEFKTGHSNLYAITRFLLVMTSQLFYRRAYYKGIKDIPRDAGVIFAPNHQSAFMDALMTSHLLKTQNRYLVRADIFKNPMVSKLLTFFNLLPIYRQRDGADSMEKNEQIFKTSEDAIIRKETMIIFPEGNQADFWKLRPLKKGYARIAFGALKKAPKDVALYIVPTGINYYNFTDYRGELVIEYGEAINIRDFQELFDESEAKAINGLRERLSSVMSPLMFDIRDKDYYDEIKEVSHLLTDMTEELKLDFETRKKFFKSCGSTGEETAVKTKALEIVKILKEKNVKAEDLRMAKNGKLFFALKPIFWIVSLLSTLINGPIIYPVEWLVKNKIKDHHFHASIRFVICNYLFPGYYGLILLAVSLFFNWGIGVIIVLGMAMFSYVGIMVKDKLKYNSKRSLIKEQVSGFDSFNLNISNKIIEIKDLIS